VLKKLSALALSAALVFAAGSASAKEDDSPYWQCVTFARSITGMNIFGDAWTWWEKASGKYEKGFAPKPGAVLVFRPQGKMRLGHVAVVSQVITDRVIQITHANWSPIGGRRGQVEKDVTVVDVSDKGDWSKVKVWYGPIADVGTTVYPTYGFIYQAAQKGQEMGQSLVAQVLDKPTVKKPSGDANRAALRTSSRVSSKSLSATLADASDTPRSQALAVTPDEALADAVQAPDTVKADKKADAVPSAKTAKAPVNARAAATGKAVAAKTDKTKADKARILKADTSEDKADKKTSAQKTSAKKSSPHAEASKTSDVAEDKATRDGVAKAGKTANGKAGSSKAGKKAVADAEAPVKKASKSDDKPEAKKVAEAAPKKAPAKDAKTVQVKTAKSKA